MALQLEETYKGFVANYWRISDVRVNYDSSSTIVELQLFKDKSTREDNRSSFVKRQRFNLQKLYPETSQSDLRDAIYVDLKDLVTGIEFNEETQEKIEIKKFANAKDI
jgi:hypothetical protein